MVFQVVAVWLLRVLYFGGWWRWLLLFGCWLNFVGGSVWVYYDCVNSVVLLASWLYMLF